MDSAFAEEVIRTGEAPASEVEAAEASAEKQNEQSPTYRFVLHPMWMRPVRGLVVVELWVIMRRASLSG
ncbi:hypothetical protein GCM10010302_16880 [Streptomyces polychromogenes]|uniref:Uncharacterized protein n=1 Tax=Streptomyces polychromogenes TaxID=67342 RepID=A0ABN0V7T5_9ACTN